MLAGSVGKADGNASETVGVHKAAGGAREAGGTNKTAGMTVRWLMCWRSCVAPPPPPSRSRGRKRPSLYSHTSSFFPKTIAIYHYLLSNGVTANRTCSLSPQQHLTSPLMAHICSVKRF